MPAEIMMYPLVASLEYIFCFGGWTASCVVFFHLIVSFYGTEMTENLVIKHMCSSKLYFCTVRFSLNLMSL